jgi:hypothetical protein
VLPHLTTDAPLPSNTFIAAFNFGRSEVLRVPDEPGLINSADFPDLAAVWNSPAPFFFSLDFRQGTPTMASQVATLPLARFGAVGLFVRTERLPDLVPAPAALALFGLGVVAVGLRRLGR